MPLLTAINSYAGVGRSWLRKLLTYVRGQCSATLPWPAKHPHGQAAVVRVVSASLVDATIALDYSRRGTNTLFGVVSEYPAGVVLLNRPTAISLTLAPGG